MKTERPNLILIMTDQQRGDCLGIDGHPVLQTPNMDHLAASGARFSRGYSECPSCIPARRCLMTGTSPAANGVVGFSPVEFNPAHTLPGVLSANGYETRHIGKLHMHPFDVKRFGFQHCEWNSNYHDWLREVHHRVEENPSGAHGVGNNSWVGRPHFMPEEQLLTFWLFDRALRFLKSRDTTVPFFLKISTSDPHPSLTPPQFYYDRYIQRPPVPPVKGDWVDTFDGPTKGLSTSSPDICLPDDDFHCAQAGYFGMINFIDDQIGRFLNTAIGRCPNTMIIFTSDHGEMLGDHQKFQKSLPYESSARIPFLVRPPESWGLAPNQVHDCPVGLQDIMPTFLDAAGINVPETCTGRSLLPVLRGDTLTVRDYIHGESAPYGVSKGKDLKPGHHYLSDGKTKYIWFTECGTEQLFDLVNDPKEVHDLATRPEDQTTLQKWRSRMIDVLDGRPEGFTDGTRLIAGQPYGMVMPNYDPDRISKFL